MIFSLRDIGKAFKLLHCWNDPDSSFVRSFDHNQYSAKKGLFCPFAHRLPPPEVASLAKDLASEYHYLGNTSEWFFIARKNAEGVIARNEQYIKGNYRIVSH